jgi:uncharacterized protein (DUF1800 family)
MELFSLGEGNYTEQDVREMARALTGYQGESGHFVFDTELHDHGEKHILGHTGEFTGDDLPKVLVAQEACARYVCRKLLLSFEGVEPDEARLAEYAAALREADHKLEPLLRKLCTDPRFYRDEVVSCRVQGPIEWLVGAARRLGVAPPGHFVYFAAAALGQQIYAPPTVEGWDEGEAWITHSSLLMRGKCIELLLRHNPEQPEVELQDLVGAEEQAALMREVHAYEIPEPDLVASAAWDLGANAEDDVIAAWATHEWLARPALCSTPGWLLSQLEAHRNENKVTGPLLQHEGAEQVLRRMAHNLLSLPIGQLN